MTAPHDWIPSTLGHGETMCRNCSITNREAAALGCSNECDSAPTPSAPAAGHSPGPWEAVGTSVQQYEIRDGEKLWGLYIADCSMLDEGEANARLIAAALNAHGFECMARKQSLPEPSDCDWPTCGCDPHADRVIAALEERGIAAAPDLKRQRDDLLKALEESRDWHEQQDKVLSKSGRADSEYYYFRHQHQAEIERIDSAIASARAPSSKGERM